MKGQMNVIVALIMGVIGLVIVAAVITAGNFTGLTGTITTYIVPMFAIGLLALAAFAYAKR